MIVSKRLAVTASLFTAAVMATLAFLHADPSESPGPVANNVQAYALGTALHVGVAQSTPGFTTSSREFNLPPALSAHAGGWYMVDARLQLSLGTVDPRYPIAEVDVGVNGKAGIELSLTGDALGKPLGVWWGTDSLTRGYVLGGFWTEHERLRITDFLPYHAIHHGHNAVYIRLFDGRSQLIKSAELLPGSRIMYSRLAPALLRVRLRPASHQVTAGRVMPIHYMLSDRGMPAINVGIMASISRDGMTLLSPPTQTLGVVAGTRTGAIDVLALTPGAYRISLWAIGSTGTGPGNGVVARTKVVVVPAPKVPG